MRKKIEKQIAGTLQNTSNFEKDGIAFLWVGKSTSSGSGKTLSKFIDYHLGIGKRKR